MSVESSAESRKSGYSAFSAKIAGRYRLGALALACAAVLALTGCGGGGGGDSTAPTVSVTSHADGATITTLANITVSGTLADDGTISSLTVLHGGVDVTAAVAPTFDQSSFSFPLVLAAGNNTLEVQATDEAANTGTSGAVNLLTLVVTQIAAGGVHTCALLDTGAVRCWGFGFFGHLGHNATASIGDGLGDSIMVAGDVPVFP